ncbi:leucine rich repeat domain-containing protein [Ditylenchus destructor]|uniref:Leucine rich repeat domain-containing protein n=1 Tax=Ditylenchus destructor TaxID=166010 RepID=A0AAD4NE82_9BILA|nr:leucine rich repeat domain-containing protein [Ditylenchus destructor]
MLSRTIIFLWLYYFVDIFNPERIIGVNAQRFPTSISCPINFQSTWCTCSLLQFEQVGVFCDKTAGSIEQVIYSLTPLASIGAIEFLRISNTPIHTLKPRAFGSLIVRHLVLLNNSLVEIEKEAFTGHLLDSLEELEISWNTLTAIPKDGIANLKRLKSLSITNSRITNIEPFTFLHFYSRNSIETLDLSGNQLTSVPAQSLLGLEGLRRLTLDKNQISDIPTDAIQTVYNSLEELWLGVNQIHSVGKLPSMPKLKALSLDVNRISTISTDSFENTPNLLYLHLSNNAFSEIDFRMFQRIGQLKLLSMNYNMISRLDKETFQFVPSLVRLELSNCFISSIEEDTFNSIPKIQFISLSNNKLRKVPQRVFSSLPRVIAMDLSRNMISHVEDFAFSGLSSLQLLDLSNNQIERLPPNILYNTFYSENVSTDPTRNTVRVLNLHDNPWNCDKNIVWMIEWLKKNSDIQITLPGNLPTSCDKPIQLKGTPLRSVDDSLLTRLTQSQKPDSLTQTSLHKWQLTKTTPQVIASPTSTTTTAHIPNTTVVDSNSSIVTTTTTNADLLPSLRRRVDSDNFNAHITNTTKTVLAETNVAGTILVVVCISITLFGLVLIVLRTCQRLNAGHHYSINGCNTSAGSQTREPVYSPRTGKVAAWKAKHNSTVFYSPSELGCPPSRQLSSLECARRHHSSPSTVMRESFFWF